MSRLYPDYRSHPMLCDVSEDAVDVLCAIYLAHPARASMIDLPDAEFVKIMADLHHANMFRIEQKPNGDFRFVMTLGDGGTLQ